MKNTVIAGLWLALIIGLPAGCGIRQRVFEPTAEGEGEMTMRVLLILAAFSFSAAAFAQTGPPKVGDKPLVQVKPKGPTGCKLVGTFKDTKLWAGDCVGSELRGAISATETQSLSERATAVIPPGQKQ
jgi:hypothetical protein